MLKDAKTFYYYTKIATLLEEGSKQLLTHKDYPKVVNTVLDRLEKLGEKSLVETIYNFATHTKTDPKPFTTVSDTFNEYFHILSQTYMKAAVNAIAVHHVVVPVDEGLFGGPPLSIGLF